MGKAPSHLSREVPQTFLFWWLSSQRLRGSEEGLPASHAPPMLLNCEAWQKGPKNLEGESWAGGWGRVSFAGSLFNQEQTGQQPLNAKAVRVPAWPRDKAVPVWSPGPGVEQPALLLPQLFSIPSLPACHKSLSFYLTGAMVSRKFSANAHVCSSSRDIEQRRESQLSCVCSETPRGEG